MDSAKPPTVKKRRYVPAIGPRLRPLLAVVFGLFALLAVNATYLASVTVVESITGNVYQNWFYLINFLVHLVLGALIVIPVIVFGFAHMRNTHDRRNRRAVKVGYGLFTTALLLLASGIVLTRLEGVIEVKDPAVRSVAYWVHVVTPLLAVWLFILHRLAGKKIRWRVGLTYAGVDTEAEIGDSAGAASLAGLASMGSVTRKTEPRFTSLLTEILPPWASRIWVTM